MDNVKDIGEQIVKKRKGNNPNGSPLLGDRGLMVEKGDNAKYIKMSMEVMNMPDIDIRNPEQVQQRVNDYFGLCFENDMKPAVSGLSMALGLDRRRLWEIKSGVDRTAYPDLPLSVVDSIKKAYKIMESLWENYMLNGKINPVSGIFLGKNQFDYQDKSEYVLTPNNPLGSDSDPATMAQKYQSALPETTILGESEEK